MKYVRRFCIFGYRFDWKIINFIKNSYIVINYCLSVNLIKTVIIINKFPTKETLKFRSEEKSIELTDKLFSTKTVTCYSNERLHFNNVVSFQTSKRWFHYLLINTCSGCSPLEFFAMPENLELPSENFHNTTQKPSDLFWVINVVPLR